MKKLTGIIGAAFVLFVSVAAIDSVPFQEPSAKPHAHVAAKTCCDKEGGMCARTDADKNAKGCCNKPECCKDGCCKDGTCKENCTCECCKTGNCCAQPANGGKAKMDSCCKHKNTSGAKKPALAPSH